MWWLRLIVNSLAGGMEEEIAEFENRVALALGNCYADPVSGSEARVWFSSGEVKPRSSPWPCLTSVLSAMLGRGFGRRLYSILYGFRG